VLEQHARRGDGFSASCVASGIDDARRDFAECLKGYAARPQDGGRIDGEVDDRGLYADVSRARVEDELYSTGQISIDVLGSRGAGTRE
jgi:hypothetical protein